MKYQTITRDVCHLCRDYLLTHHMSSRLNKREQSWLREVDALSHGENWHDTGIAQGSTECEACTCDEPDIVLYRLTCEAPIVENTELDWHG